MIPRLLDFILWFCFCAWLSVAFFTGTRLAFGVATLILAIITFMKTRNFDAHP